MAAVLPIIAGKAAGDKDKIKAALSNDIAVLRGTTKPRGKGKKSMAAESSMKCMSILLH